VLALASTRRAGLLLDPIEVGPSPQAWPPTALDEPHLLGGLIIAALAMEAERRPEILDTYPASRTTLAPFETCAGIEI